MDKNHNYFCHIVEKRLLSICEMYHVMAAAFVLCLYTLPHAKLFNVFMMCCNVCLSVVNIQILTMLTICQC